MNSHLKLKNKLKEFRQQACLTQTQLAEKIGSSKNTISSIETGQFCPTAYLAALLCIALNCRFEELFYFEED
ncbi:MAG: helix-turn-helix transcriptional regulator [Ruminococcaceae bacterium]|nr:helix-turn-helix transcriptional regulator [Oscillospiraceae bacterium]